MKNARRLAVLVLVAALVFNTSNVFLNTSGVVDDTPPTFNSVIFNRTSANVGEVVKIFASFSDAGSGINYGYAHLNSTNNPYNDIVSSVYLSYNVSSGLLQGEFEVNKYWYADLYIEYIYVYDKDYNTGFAYNNLNYTSPVLFTFGNTPDYDAPVFNSVQFDRSSANANEMVSIYASFTDLGSGIDYGYAYLNSSNNPDWDILTSVYLQYNASTGYLEGSFEVYQYWPADLYIAYIYAYDFAGNDVWAYHNTNYISPVLFTFGTTPDYDPPVFDWVQFDRASANVDEIVTITVSVTDTISGPNYGYAYLNSTNNPEWNTLTSVNLQYNSSTGYLEGSFEVFKYWPADLYVSSIYAYDVVGNYMPEVYHNVHYTSPVLTTFGNIVDNDPPTILSVWADQNSAYEYEPIVFFATIYDEISGPNWAYAYFYDENYNQVTSTNMWFDDTYGAFRGEISFQPGNLPSMFLHSMEVMDVAGNHAWYYNGTDFSTFHLFNLGPDTIPPVIMTNDLVDYGTYWGEFSIEVSSTERGFGDVYMDGLWIADLEFSAPSSFWLNTYNWENGLHELRIEAWDYAGNNALPLIFNIYIENDKRDQYIEVNVNPNNGQSTVGDNVTFEVKVLSTFLHDMPEVHLEIGLKTPNGEEDILMDQFFYLEAQNEYFFTFEVFFKETGFYKIEAVLFDDIGVSWSQGFEWVVNPSDHSTSTETDPINNETTQEISNTPSVELPGFTNVITVFGILSLVLIVRKRKH
ncbi:MAG: hypothetical protein ACXAD7_25935 [Candidatus Kariarchaeaceae archaeon]|jgi:hypothetical protein